MQHQLDAAINHHMQQHEINRQHADHYNQALQHAQWYQPQNQHHHQELQMAHQHYQNEAAVHLQKMHELDRQRQQQYQTRHHQQATPTVSANQIVRIDNTRHFNGAHSNPHATILELRQHIAKLESEINRLEREIQDLEIIIHNQYISLQHLNSLIKNGETYTIMIDETTKIAVAVQNSEKLLAQMKKDVVEMHNENYLLKSTLEGLGKDVTFV
jgi:hypothetical protein